MRNPFFRRNEELRLGEEFIASKHYPFYVAGTIASELASNGLYNYDMNPGNWLMNQWGQFTCIDYGMAETAKIDPEKACRMLEGIFLTFPRDAFDAILSGFVTYAITFIDPVCAGFSSHLLESLGGNVVSVPKPRQRALDLRSIEGLLDARFDLEDGRVTVSRAKDGAGALLETLRRGDCDAFCAMTYLILSGIDPPHLSLEDASETAESYVSVLTEILSNFVARREIEEHRVQRVSQTYGTRAGMAASVLQALVRMNPAPGCGIGNPGELPVPQQPDVEAYRAVFECVSRTDSAVTSEFVDGLIDFSNALSGWLDSTARERSDVELQMRSISFSQIAFIGLQAIAPHCGEERARVMRVLQDQAALTWNRVTRTSSPEGSSRTSVRDYLCIREDELFKPGEPPGGDQSLLSKIVFLDSMATAHGLLFRAISDAKPTLWSILRDALRYERLAILLAIGRMEEHADSADETPQLGQILPALIGTYAGLLRDHLSNAVRHLDPYNSLPWKERGPYKQGLRWATEVLSFCRTESLLTGSGRSKLAAFRRIR